MLAAAAAGDARCLEDEGRFRDSVCVEPVIDKEVDIRPRRYVLLPTSYVLCDSAAVGRQWC